MVGDLIAPAQGRRRRHLPDHATTCRTCSSSRDRLAVMKNGRLVGTYRTADVTEDEVLGMIIAGKRPEGKAEVRRATSSKSALS